MYALNVLNRTAAKQFQQFMNWNSSPDTFYQKNVGASCNPWHSVRCFDSRAALCIFLNGRRANSHTYLHGQQWHGCARENQTVKTFLDAHAVAGHESKLQQEPRFWMTALERRKSCSLKGDRANSYYSEVC